MAKMATPPLSELTRCLSAYGDGSGETKLALLRTLERASLPRAADVLKLHEALCFLRAYPDDLPLLRQVERMLRSFEKRRDLRRHARLLADTGIAGTAIHYVFFWPMARWLTRRWGDRLAIDWPSYAEGARLEDRLHLLAAYPETPGLDEWGFPLREWLDRLKGPAETDGAFLVRRFEALKMPEEVREVFYQELGIPLRLDPGPTTPARTRARYRAMPVVYQAGPLTRTRPSLPAEIDRPPRSVRDLSPREGRKLVDLAREAMVTRARDLDVFSYGDPADVRLVDCGEGLQFAVFSAVPARRLLLESVHGFLTFHSGVPIGYVLTSALFGSSEIAYNVFETYRGAEAAHIYGRVLAVVRTLFTSDAFTIYPYQLGHGNQEGLESGAWWFYQKLGFRPQEPGVVRLMNEELRRMGRVPSHRSSIATLKRLAGENMYLYMGKPRADVIGLLSLGNVGLQVTRFLSERFGSDREKATRVCSREAMELLGVGSLRGFSPGERLAWSRWSPLACILPGVREWSPAERTALAEVMRAKGGRHESDFVHLFDQHHALRAAVRSLAEAEI